MIVDYDERMMPDGSWEKIPVYIAETQEERERLEAEVLRDNPEYYAGFSEVHADPNHPLHERVTRMRKERLKKEVEALKKSDE